MMQLRYWIWLGIVCLTPSGAFGQFFYGPRPFLQPWGGSSYYGYNNYYGPVVVQRYGFGYGGPVGPAVGLYGPAPISPPPRVNIPSNAYSYPMQDELFTGQQRWSTPVASQPVLKLTRKKVFRPSTPESQLKSLRFQQQADLQVREGKYVPATANYRSAISTAEDRPEPYFRLATVLMMRGQFVEAIELFKTGVQLDPTWPKQGVRLNDLLGEDQQLTKLEMQSKLTKWVEEDIRNPDRLYLLGVVLHLMEDQARSQTVFETAVKLGGKTDALDAFLNSDGHVQTPQPNPASAPPAVVIPNAKVPQVSTKKQTLPGLAEPPEEGQLSPHVQIPLGTPTGSTTKLPPNSLPMRSDLPPKSDVPTIPIRPRQTSPNPLLPGPVLPTPAE